MSAARRLARILLAASLFPAGAPAQVAENANAHYHTEQQRKHMADMLLRAERDRQQKPQELVDALGIRPGMTVADVGTGAGYMLPFLSRAVGPNGRVLAEDIYADFLQRANERARAEGLENVRTILGTETDASLPPGAVDLGLVLDAYHHFNYPGPMLASLRRALRPNGRLAIVEYYRRPGAMPGGDAVEHVRADQDEVIREVQANRFRLTEKRDHIPGRQYIAVFVKRHRHPH